MLTWAEGILDAVVAVILVGAIGLVTAIVLPRLLRRVHTLLRGEVEIVLEPWTFLASEPTKPDLSAAAAEMLLFKLRRIQDIHARTVNRIEISNSYRDVPTFTQGMNTDIDLLASEDLQGEVGRVAAATSVILRLLPLLTPRTRMHGSVRQFGSVRTLEVTLEHFPVLSRRTSVAGAGAITRGGRLKSRWARILHLVFGRRQARTWFVHNDSATEDNLRHDVTKLAYNIYLDLLGDDSFKSWRTFHLFTRGLGLHVRYMDLGREKDLEGAAQLYQQALDIEPKNQVVSYNLGVIAYMRYKSAESNREAIRLFYNATSTPNPHLRARALAGAANAEAMAVDRFGEGGVLELQEARSHAEQAVREAPRLDATQKALAYTTHQLADWHSRNAARAGHGGTSGQREKWLTYSDYSKQAEKAYKAAIKYNPNHFVAYNNLGNLYLGMATEFQRLGGGERPRQRTLKRAQTALVRALQINPAFPFAHDNLGNVYYELGEFEKAYQSYSDALRHDRDYPEAHNDLAKLLLEYGGALTGETPEKKHRDALDAAERKAPEGAEGRLDKLCAQFEQRYQEVRRLQGHEPSLGTHPCRRAAAVPVQG